MNTPHLYFVPELVEWAQHTQTNHPEAGWIPARPLGFQGFSLRTRLKLAWAVFTGKYDAVYWEPTLNDLHPSRNRDLDNLLKTATLAAMGVPVQHLPPKVDLSRNMPPVEDQGELNSSTAFAVATAMQNAAPNLELTSAGCLPLLYYNERATEEKQ